jgi:hypothetical protein
VNIFREIEGWMKLVKILYREKVSYNFTNAVETCTFDENLIVVVSKSRANFLKSDHLIIIDLNVKHKHSLYSMFPLCERGFS